MNEMITVISPHIDDAIFSLGLSIEDSIAKASTVQIINCFSVSNFTIINHSQDTDVVTSIRKNEDWTLNQIFNDQIRFDYLDMMDFPLRSENTDINSEENLLLIKTLCDKLSPLIDSSSMVYSPLSIGDHIDHRICLEAILRIKLEGSIKVTFYEDLPYSQDALYEMFILKVKCIEDRIRCPLVPRLNRFSSVDKKSKLINVYRSQLNESVANDIIKYAISIEGERVWELSKTNKR